MAFLKGDEEKKNKFWLQIQALKYYGEIEFAETNTRAEFPELAGFIEPKSNYLIWDAFPARREQRADY